MEPLFEKLKSNAIANRQRIILPESTEPRTLTAANRIIADGIADIVLIGDKAEILAKAAELGLENIDKATVVNPNDAEAVVAEQVVLTVRDAVLQKRDLLGQLADAEQVLAGSAEGARQPGICG